MTAEKKSLTRAGVESLVKYGTGPLAPLVNNLIDLAIEQSSASKMSKAVQASEQEEFLRDIVKDEMRSELQSHVGAMHERLADLEAELKRDDKTGKAAISDLLAAATEVVEQAYKTTDRRKRELLVAALVNTFDPQLYATGLLQDVLLALESLTYADIAALKQILEQSPNGFAGNLIYQNKPFVDPYHVRKLVDAHALEDGAVRWSGHAASWFYVTPLAHALVKYLKGAPE